MSAETEKEVAEMRAGIMNSMRNVDFAYPDAAMLRARLSNVLALLIGDHVRKIAIEHANVTQVQDSLIIEIDEPLADIMASVFGSNLVDALLVDNQIILKGWSKQTPVCDSIDETIIKKTKPKLYDEEPPRPERTERPRSRRVWDQD